MDDSFAQETTMTSLKPGRTGRPTIGFLISAVGSTGQAVWEGVLDAAQRLNINLICYIGGAAQSLESTVGANVLFSLVNASRLDGLVSWASTICPRLNPT